MERATRSSEPERTTRTRDIDNVDAFLKEMRDKIVIDKHRLDDMLEWQVEATMRLGDVVALQISYRDQAEDNIKVEDALLDEDFRNEARAKSEKITEDAIKKKIITSKQHLKAVRDHAMEKKTTLQVMAVQESYRQRSHALRELVTLYSSGYFADRAATPREMPAHRQTYGRDRDRRDR